MAIDLEYAKAVLEGRPASSGSGGGGDILWYQLPKEGSVKVRLLPPVGDEKLPGKLVYTHWNIPGINRIVCFKTFGKPCPCCDMLAQFSNRLSTEDWDPLAKAYFNALIQDDSTVDPKVPRILGTNGDYNLYWVIEQLLDKDIGDISDPRTGRGIKFHRKQKGGSFDRILLNNSPIADTNDEIEFILSKSYNFNTIWKLPTEDEYKEIMSAIGNLKKMIEDKLLVLQSTNSAPTSQEPWTPPNQPPAPSIPTAPTPPVAQPQVPQTPVANDPPPFVPDPPAAQTGAPNRPPNSPECYSISWKDGETKCLICPHELMCKTAMAK